VRIPSTVTTICLLTAAALFLAAPAVAQTSNAGSGPRSGGGGQGYNVGSAGGAPLPALGVTILGQAAAAGGVMLVWLRRRRRTGPKTGSGPSRAPNPNASS
jgi:uncharacterized membrane protein YccC